jgi:hypothetical protein
MRIKFFLACPGFGFDSCYDWELIRTLKTFLSGPYCQLYALRSFYHKIDYHYENGLPEKGKRRPYASSLQTPMKVTEIKAFQEEHDILKEFVPEGLPQSLLYPAQRRMRD